MKHGGTQQRVNKHNRDNWCQKTPTFLWSFVCSEKMLLFCDSSSFWPAAAAGDLARHTKRWRYYLTILKIELFFSLYLSMWCQAMPQPAVSHLCDRVLRDRDNVWHCGRKLIPAWIIIRSSPDKSVMICDSVTLRSAWHWPGVTMWGRIWGLLVGVVFCVTSCLVCLPS